MRFLFVFFALGLTLLLVGCASTESDQPPVAHALELKLSDVTVAPGETVTLEAVVEPAGNWGFRWQVTGGKLAASGANATFEAPQTLGEYTVSVAVPAYDLEDAVTVNVESGSRAVTLASLSGSTRMATGASLALAATVTGQSTEELHWYSEGGELDVTGLDAVFTAPHEAGHYEVTASLPDDSAVVGSLTIDVSGAILEPFTVAVIPDMQTLVLHEELRPLVEGIGEWLVENVDDHKIAFVTQLGDVVWHATTASAPSADEQWEAARDGLDKLDGVIPYSVSLGDHEYEVEEDKTSSTAAFHQHFGPARYVDYDWYGGSHEDGLSHYQIFEAGGRQFLHLNLEWEADGPVEDPSTPLGWAKSVLEAHPQLPTFISTHAYLWDEEGKEGHFPDSVREGFLGTKGNISPHTTSGVGIFEALVEPFPQVLMVFNGHYHKDTSAGGSRGEYHQTSLNAAGLEVYEMLSNYQWMHRTTDPDWIRLIEFQPGTNDALYRIDVSTFSPSRGEYRPDESSNVSFELDLAERLAFD